MSDDVRLSPLRRNELIALIREAFKRAKGEKGESYSSMNTRFNLTSEQSKTIRGVKGGGGVSNAVLQRVYRQMLEERFLEPTLPAERSIFGFKAPYQLSGKPEAFRREHHGVYLTVGVSTLSQGKFFIGTTEITDVNGELLVTHKMFDKFEEEDEPTHISYGHAYFVAQQIYMFLEEAFRVPDEIMVIMVNQSDIPPPDILFGLYFGRGQTRSSNSHPAAAPIAFLRLVDVEAGSYQKMREASVLLRRYDTQIHQRWIDRKELQALLDLPKPIFRYLTAPENGDGSLRGIGPRA